MLTQIYTIWPVLLFIAFSAQKSTNQTKMASLPTTHVSYVVALSHATYKEIINGQSG